MRTFQKEILLGLSVTFILRLPFLFQYLGGETFYHSTSPNNDMAYYTFISYTMARGFSLLPIHTAYPALLFYIQMPFFFVLQLLHIKSFWVYMLVTRILSLTFHVLTMIVIGKIISILTDSNRFAILVGMLAYTSFPLSLFINTHWGKITHTLMSLMTVITIYYAILASKKRNQSSDINNESSNSINQYLILSFIFAGLTFGSKYDAGLVVLAPMVVALYEFRFNIIKLFKCGIIFLGAFIFTTPFWIIKPSTYFSGLLWIINYNSSQELTYLENLSFFIQSMTLNSTGPYLVIFGIFFTSLIFYICWAFLKNRNSSNLMQYNIIILVFLGFITVYLAGFLDPQPRNLTQLLILMPIIISLTLNILESKISKLSLLKKGSKNKFINLSRLLYILIIVNLLLSSSMYIFSEWQINNSTNTYEMTKNYISLNINPEYSIAMDFNVKIPNTHTNISSLGYVANLDDKSMIELVQYIIILQASYLGSGLQWMRDNSSIYIVEAVISSNTSQVYYYTFTPDFHPIDMFRSFIDTGQFLPGIHGPSFVIIRNSLNMK